MRGKWLFWVRRTHLYLGVFFSPFLLLFIVTGVWQTVTVDRNKGIGASVPLIQKLSDIHIEQYYPLSGSHHFTTWMAKTFTVIMSVAVGLTILLGLVLSFVQIRNKVPVAVALILGILIPVLLLWIAHW